MLKGYGPVKLMNDFPDKNWKRRGLEDLLKKSTGNWDVWAEEQEWQAEICAQWRKCFIHWGLRSWLWVRKANHRPIVRYARFGALSSSACTSHEFTTLRNWSSVCWTFCTALNRVQLIAQLTSGERVFAPAYGPKENILSNYCDIMLSKWAAFAAPKQCSKFVDCIFQIG